MSLDLVISGNTEFHSSVTMERYFCVGFDFRPFTSSCSRAVRYQDRGCWGLLILLQRAPGHWVASAAQAVCCGLCCHFVQRHYSFVHLCTVLFITTFLMHPTILVMLFSQLHIFQILQWSLWWGISEVRQRVSWLKSDLIY